METTSKPTDSINLWKLLLMPIDLQAGLKLNERATKIKGGASLTYQRDCDSLILPAKPRLTQKQEIIRLFDKGNNVNAIQLITGYGLKYIRRTLIAKNRIKSSYNRNGRRQLVVIQRSAQGEYIAEFDSIAIAARELGIEAESIRRICNGDAMRKTAGGYKFEFKWLK